TTLKRRVAAEVALGTLPDGREVSLQAPVPTPSAGLAADEEIALLHQALERLPDDYRRVVHLRSQEGRSFEETGPLMGRTANAVGLLWLRAVERVKHELRPLADG